MQNAAFPILVALLVFLQVCSGTWVETGNLTVSYTFFERSGQGVASDSDFIYWSGKNMLKKSIVTEGINITVTNTLYPAIPSVMGMLGYNHIGDIDVFDGIIYAPIEEPSHTRPVIAAYNTDLQFLDLVVTSQRHMPWVAVDPSTKLLYSSEFDNVTSLYVYNTSHGLQSHGVVSISVPSVDTLTAIQGGFIYQDLLYLSSSWNSQVFTVYVVQLETGQWLPDQTFCVASTGEAEGITVTSQGNMLLVQSENPQNYILQCEQSNRRNDLCNSRKRT